MRQIAAPADPDRFSRRHLQQGMETDHFRVKENMPKVGDFQSFITARRTIAGFEAMLWLREGLRFSGGLTKCKGGMRSDERHPDLATCPRRRLVSSSKASAAMCLGDVDV
ncbi:DDE-type integrase/transposase/recombinase [Mesorhizobium sp. ZC-5]|uniref:DDE-type integrase/transposase/recombinase n=1 Tax=Mesorhizobium TaxID=68287 RepID=UPI0039934E8F